MHAGELTKVDLSEYWYAPQCDMCSTAAVIIAKGCMDKQPVVLCQEHFDHGVKAIGNLLKLWRKINKRVMICGDCNRPILTLETHLDVRQL